jgi:hypothetical protein
MSLRTPLSSRRFFAKGRGGPLIAFCGWRRFRRRRGSTREALPALRRRGRATGRPLGKPRFFFYDGKRTHKGEVL